MLSGMKTKVWITNEVISLKIQSPNKFPEVPI